MVVIPVFPHVDTDLRHQDYFDIKTTNRMVSTVGAVGLGGILPLANVLTSLSPLKFSLSP